MTTEDIKILVVHTAASRGHCDAATIRRWHVEERGWSDIGYHFVIKKDGIVEDGRPLSTPGAHVRGLNGESWGICCCGHGDEEPHTPEQRASLIGLLSKLRAMAPQAEIVGHREATDTPKTCPGTLIDMDEIRRQVDAPQTPRSPRTPTTADRAEHPEAVRSTGGG